MIAFNFLDFGGSKNRYEQETIMFKRFPNAWPNTKFRIKGVGDDPLSITFLQVDISKILMYLD